MQLEASREDLIRVMSYLSYILKKTNQILVGSVSSCGIRAHTASLALTKCYVISSSISCEVKYCWAL